MVIASAISLPLTYLVLCIKPFMGKLAETFFWGDAVALALVLGGFGESIDKMNVANIMSIAYSHRSISRNLHIHIACGAIALDLTWQTFQILIVFCFGVVLPSCVPVQSSGQGKPGCGNQTWS